MNPDAAAAAFDTEIRERIAAQAAAASARLEARRNAQADHTRARTAGLHKRHARKQKHLKERAHMDTTTPPPRGLGSPAQARTAARVALPGPVRSGLPDMVEREQLQAGIGARLVLERRVRGLSQRRLADLAGVARSTVQRVEAGRIRPTTALLEALAHALVVPPGHTPDRAAIDALSATLAAVAGSSLVQSTPGGERRRRRRLRKARLAANAAAVPALRTALGMPQ